MKVNSSKPLVWGLFTLILLVTTGCQLPRNPLQIPPTPTPAPTLTPEPTEDFLEMLGMSTIIPNSGFAGVCKDCTWGFTLDVERFGVIYEQGFRSEATQLGEIPIEGNETKIMGSGFGDINFEVMMDQECPVMIEAPVIFHVFGEFDTENCTVEIIIVYKADEGKATSPCFPDYMYLPGYAEVYLAMVDAYSPDPFTANLAALKSNVSRPEVFGNIEWTSSYTARDFYGATRCVEAVGAP